MKLSLSLNTNELNTGSTLSTSAISPRGSGRSPRSPRGSSILSPRSPTGSAIYTPRSPRTQEGLEFLFVRDIEFRQETLYFIVTDRFYDGDKSNDWGPNPTLFDPSRQDWQRYWGGDIKGVIDKLDYLQGMGVTAIWLTPLFEQVERFHVKRAAIHGYWTKDFKRINPRFVGRSESISLTSGERTVFDDLITELHKRGMKFILDIVCNHSTPGTSDTKGLLYDDGKLIANFNNDINHWYHHYGEVTDWQDEWQIQNCELAGLASFNENNPEYRAYIKSAIKLWLDRGVDALRIDTVKHMPIWFWQEFTSDMRFHKPEVFIFGEWIYNHPNDPKSMDYANHAGMSLLDFAVCGAIRAGIALKDPRGFHCITEVYELDGRYDHATELITFYDNHDMPRFQSLNSDPDLLKVATILLMTARGIPCIYYGTEQYLHNDTNGGDDPYNRPMMDKFDIDTPIYRILSILSKVRRSNAAISRGDQTHTYVTPEVLCFSRRFRNYRCFTALNQSETEQALPHPIETHMDDGEYFCHVTFQKYTIENSKLHNLVLPPKSGIVLSKMGTPVIGKTVVRAECNGIQTKYGDTVHVSGSCPELGNWDIEKAVPMNYINTNTWYADIPFNESAGKAILYKYVIIHPGRQPIRENIPARKWILIDSGEVKWRDKWGGIYVSIKH